MALPFEYINRRGTVEVSTSSVSATATEVTYTFPNHAFAGAWYKGLVVVKINQPIPTGTAGTLPIVFSTNGATQAVTVQGGTPLTADDIPGVGVYLFYFNKSNNTLQLF